MPDSMGRCLGAQVGGVGLMMPPLLRVDGLGKQGFWSVVKELAGLDMGIRSNQEWQALLVKLFLKHMPASSR
jgi:hypothetical protein